MPSRPGCRSTERFCTASTWRASIVSGAIRSRSDRALRSNFATVSALARGSTAASNAATCSASSELAWSTRTWAWRQVTAPSLSAAKVAGRSARSTWLSAMRVSAVRSGMRRAQASSVTSTRRAITSGLQPRPAAVSLTSLQRRAWSMSSALWAAIEASMRSRAAMLSTRSLSVFAMAPASSRGSRSLVCMSQANTRPPTLFERLFERRRVRTQTRRSFIPSAAFRWR